MHDSKILSLIQGVFGSVSENWF